MRTPWIGLVGSPHLSHMTCSCVTPAQAASLADSGARRLYNFLHADQKANQTVCVKQSPNRYLRNLKKALTIFREQCSSQSSVKKAIQFVRQISGGDRGAAAGAKTSRAATITEEGVSAASAGGDGENDLEGIDERNILPKDAKRKRTKPKSIYTDGSWITTEELQDLYSDGDPKQLQEYRNSIKKDDPVGVVFDDGEKQGAAWKEDNDSDYIIDDDVEGGWELQMAKGGESRVVRPGARCGFISSDLHNDSRDSYVSLLPRGGLVAKGE